MNIFRNLQNNLTKIIDHFQLFYQIDRELSKQSKIYIDRFENYVKNLQIENYIFDVNKCIFEVVVVALKKSRDNIKIQRLIIIINFLNSMTKIALCSNIEFN